MFYRDVWVPGEGYDRKCLGTKNRTEADRIGRELLAQLRDGTVKPTTRSTELTLGDLWRRYRSSCAAFLDNVETTRRDAESRTKVLVAFFGDSCDVNSLTADDQAAHVSARRAGGITTESVKPTKPVRVRSVEADLVLLHQMLRWATTARVDGKPLLANHPLAGVRRAREQNPKRPIATWERYRATRAKLQELATAATDVERARWVKIELALVLAEATGRRLGSIRQLHWEDVDFTKGTIRWRAEADKKRRESVVPLPSQLLDELRAFRRVLSAVAGPVFAAVKNPAKAMDRHLFDHWLAFAERKAQLPKLVGGLWHPYRRKWATERKHLSITDVAAAGGWRDTATLLTCYTQPDNETLLAVMSEERKVREISVS